MKNISIITCPSEIGAGTRGASLGPAALQINAAEQNYPLFEKLSLARVPTGEIYPYHAHTSSIDYIQEFEALYTNIYEQYSHQVAAFDKNLILTGDHASAAAFIGTLKDNNPDSSLGVIWIDAHGDLHSPYSTPSGNMHGMPLAVTLGIDDEQAKGATLSEHVAIGWENLKKRGSHQLTPKIKPQELFFIDIRDLEAEEWAIIRENNIQYTTPEHRKKQGIAGIVQQIQHFAAHFDQVYISFDVDSLDASLVPGTGTPVADGLNWQEAATLLKACWAMPNTKALEITEINPLKDQQNQIAHHVNQIIRQLEGLNLHPSQ